MNNTTTSSNTSSSSNTGSTCSTTHSTITTSMHPNKRLALASIADWIQDTLENESSEFCDLYIALATEDFTNERAIESMPVGSATQLLFIMTEWSRSLPLVEFVKYSQYYAVWYFTLECIKDRLESSI